MDQDRTPQQIAYALAEEAQVLNHASHGPEAFYGRDEQGTFISAAPSNVSSTVSGLSTLLGHLPQAVQHAAQALQHLEEKQAIRMANPNHAGEEVSVVLRALLNAQQAITVAHGHLREAAGPLSAMGGHFEDVDLEDADTTA